MSYWSLKGCWYVWPRLFIGILFYFNFFLLRLLYVSFRSIIATCPCLFSEIIDWFVNLNLGWTKTLASGLLKSHSLPNPTIFHWYSTKISLSKSLLTGTIGSNFMLLVHKGDLHINEDWWINVIRCYGDWFLLKAIKSILYNLKIDNITFLRCSHVTMYSTLMCDNDLIWLLQ